MGISTLLNGSLGFSTLIALLFCMPSDIQGTLDSETFYPFMSIYTYAVGSTAGATGMVSPSLDLLDDKIAITPLHFSRHLFYVQAS